MCAGPTRMSTLAVRVRCNSALMLREYPILIWVPATADKYPASGAYRSRTSAMRCSSLASWVTLIASGAPPVAALVAE